MELILLESQKGTKVVTFSNLYAALALPERQYGANARKWMRDHYEFRDGLRRPQVARDFAKRPRPGEPFEDFFLTLELAKLIALRSNSKHKIKYVRIIEAYANNGQLDLFQQAA